MMARPRCYILNINELRRTTKIIDGRHFLGKKVGEKGKVTYNFGIFIYFFGS